MASASERLERLEFTFLTRLSYWVVLLGGIGLIVDVVRILLQSGELWAVRFGIGVIAMLFTLLVWRGRSRLVAAILPEALAESQREEENSSGGEAALEGVEGLDYRPLARRFVLFGRASMMRALAPHLASLANAQGKPRINERP